MSRLMKFTSAHLPHKIVMIYNAFREYLSEGDEIVVTNQDHEANIGVWTRLETAGIHVKIWEVNKATAELEIEA